MSGAEAFPKDSELACGVAGRVASCVAGVLGHRPYGGSDTGRMKRTLRVIAVQGGAKERDFGSLQQTLGDCCNLTIFRGHVSSDTVHVLYQERFDCLEMTDVRSFVAHMIHVRACG